MRYLLGEELVAEDAVDENGFWFIKFRAPVDSERLYVGHVCFDNRVDIGSKVLDLWPIPYVMSYVSWDRAVREPLSAFGVVMFQAGGRQVP